MLTFHDTDGTITFAGGRFEAPPTPSNARQLDRHNLRDYASAVALAARASKDLAPRRFLAVDNGPGHHPRFDVIEAFEVGQEVGYGFNGDRYADGTIVRISASGRVITTSTGKRYYRHRLSGGWLRGPWCLSLGHEECRNPSF